MNATKKSVSLTEGQWRYVVMGLNNLAGAADMCQGGGLGERIILNEIEAEIEKSLASLVDVPL